MDVLQNNFWTRHVTVPTRGHNILDLVISSEPGMVDDVLVCEHLANSDHNTMFFTLMYLP